LVADAGSATASPPADPPRGGKVLTAGGNSDPEQFVPEAGTAPQPPPFELPVFAIAGGATVLLIAVVLIWRNRQ
jgi:hypothetical protein